MGKRLAAIAFIYLCTAIAWGILGATIYNRTQSSDRALSGRVGSTWGTSQAQEAPLAYVEKAESRLVDVPETRGSGEAQTTTTRRRLDTVHVKMPLTLDQTRATVAFDLAHRQKGLLWYSTYGVAFTGSYRFTNSTSGDSVVFEFHLPAAQAMYDNLRITVNGAVVPFETRNQAVVAIARIPRGQAAVLTVAYRSHGLDEWRYVLGKDVASVRDFTLQMHTNFHDIDFPATTLSPTAKQERPDGWDLTWQYSNLLSGFQIGMDMPEKLQPGPLAGEIAFFAPVSLLFFFAVMFIIVTIRRIDLHPMNYAFLAAAFFSFHLLLAYLVDHVSIHIAFGISAIVSITLVVSYLRLVVGPRFAFVEAALAQFIYLVLFSYAFFFKGFTGLAITIGSILTLFVAMQLTGRIRWSEAFAEQPRSRPGP